MRIVCTVVLMFAGAVPALARQESQEPPAPVVEVAPVSSSALLDIGALEGESRIGLVRFSSDFESHAQFAAGFLFRAPSPWISREIFGLHEDAIGAFAGLLASRINRDIDPAFDETGGGLLFVSVGLDWDFIRCGAWTGGAQVGLQYGYFGHVDDIDNGVAVLAGLSAGFEFAPGMTATVNPQTAFADSGDRLYFLNIGVQIGF